MPFDDTKMKMLATRYDVADLFISTMSALMHARWAMEKLAAGVSADTEIAAMKSDTEALGAKFDALTGWRADQ